MPETFLRGFRFLSSLYSVPRVFSPGFAVRDFGLRPNICRPSANTENSRRAREKPLVPRVDSLSSFLTTGPLWVIVKFAENGCLLDYVRKRQSQPDYINTGEDSDESKALSNLEIIRLAYGIAKGMAHLAKVKVCLYTVLHILLMIA